MADNSLIEWTDATWPIVQGCDPVSPGCAKCYVPRTIWRHQAHPNPKISGPLQGVIEKHKDKLRFSGKVVLREDRLLWPIQWKSPRKIFVPSHGDLFHDDVPNEFIDWVFAVMALCPQHTFQVLTKRSARMRAYLTKLHDEPLRDTLRRIVAAWPGRAPTPADGITIPLPNVWLGVSAEDQARADERIPDLLATPAAVRFVSAEPLLGPIDFASPYTTELFEAKCAERGIHLRAPWQDSVGGWRDVDDGCELLPGLDWIIVGGESGPGARPMHPDWARSIRDQCEAAGVPFFFKQCGEWTPESPFKVANFCEASTFAEVAWPDGTVRPGKADERGGLGIPLFRAGKAKAGRLLDGREHKGMPEVRP